jgi:hypothetical protein
MPSPHAPWRSAHPHSRPTLQDYAAVERTVNPLISKRSCKKQQMQWTERGMHLLLHTRVNTLNQELWAVFPRWYPDMQLEGEPQAA